MKKPGIIKYIEPVFKAIFYVVIFLFFAVFYNNHLHFLEQSQCFLLTSEYLLNKISLPGGISGYIGEFLTQFYYFSLAGPIIITSVLFLIQHNTRIVIAEVNPNKNLILLSFLPALVCAILLCDEYYPLSGIIGFLSALMAARLYIIINRKWYRFITGLLLLPGLYWIAGGSYIILLSLIIIYETIILYRSKSSSSVNDYHEYSGNNSFQLWQLFIYMIISITFPLVIRRTIIFQPLNLTFLSEFYYDLRTVIPAGIIILFTILPLLVILAFFSTRDEHKNHKMVYLATVMIIAAGYTGFKLNANFDAEDIYKYDHLAHNRRWKEIISLAYRRSPRNDLSLSMLNLALAKTGRIGYEMFNHEQNGDEGLFLPSAQNYFSLIHRSEIFFHLGLLNASQESAFESMETTSNLKKPVRAIKRLAEINLLNGHYEVAGKYLKLLDHTFFYRKWARETKKYLSDHDLIDKNPEWADIRKCKLNRDFFFKSQNINSIIEMLQLSLDEDPGKRIDFEYLMAHYLINKDLLNIINCLPIMNKISYREIPLNYQEALLYAANIIPVSNKPVIQDKVSEFTRKLMKEYLYTYSTNKNPKKYLQKKFEGTYWYYFDFKNIKITNN